jgi:polyisoprenoid-binding protein YceI
MGRQLARTTAAGMVLAALIAGRCGGVNAADEAIRTIDPQRSSAHFSIQHIFVARVQGTVPVRGGSVAFATPGVLPTRVSAELDAGRLHTDEPDRDAALCGPDYFDVQHFPTWTFVSTRIVATGPLSFEMEGLLTLHGVAQPEHLTVRIDPDAANPVYHATATIDRHAFGMRGARLDPVIGNTAQITLDVSLR